MDKTSNWSPSGPGLDLIIGCMYSGKTTELLRRLFVSTAVGLKVLYLNHQMDKRNSEAVYSTHNPLYKEKLENQSGLQMESVERLGDLSPLFYEQFDVIGIDEGQFFEDLCEISIQLVDELKKRVIVSGLNGDSQRKKFGDIVNLVPHCDSLQKLNSYCILCAHEDPKRLVRGIFTHRFSGEQDQQICVGGSESYRAVCRGCYLRLSSS